MGNKAQSDLVDKRRSSGRRTHHSKSGCHTCKIRRVKCDESRPACQRCISTGRVCDGYGVWGGGVGVDVSTPYNVHSQGTLLDLSTRLRLGLGNELECANFDWFRLRASVKLCGAFGSRFWDTLVLQASLTAPAVLHAVLALSSAHRVEMMEGCSPERRGARGESRLQQERFTLTQYNKTIACLQPYFTKSDLDVESLRVVLTTCTVLVCLELLRGRYVEGQTHLQSGLKLLSQLQARSYTSGAPGALVMGHPQESVSDGYLVEAFSRLCAQSSLLGQVPGASWTPYAIVSWDSTVQPPPPMFDTMNQARQHLDGLLNAICCLAERCPRKQIVRDAPEALLDEQRRLQAGLSLWLRTYKVSRVRLTSQLNPRGALSYPLLMVYQTMASIMATTCLAPADESMFDSFEASFASIVSTCEEILQVAVRFIAADMAAEYCSGRFSFTADMGLIPPLYYTALKCRIPSIRRRSIKLLRSATHKEGIWNGVVAAQVASEVAYIEERGFQACQSGIRTNRDSLYHDPDGERSAGASIPAEQRVREVLVDLSNVLFGKASLTCERKRRDGEWEMLEREVYLSQAS